MSVRIAKDLLAATDEVRTSLQRLRFQKPVTHVYHPLQYAWNPHCEYLTRYGNSPKRVLFLGMNPGPFGMAQTGIPFGEVRAVKDWMRISAPLLELPSQHPKRPILGWDCPRSEVSGRRLWGLFASRFGAPENFFQKHFVVNYCPLLFLEATGCNRTPDKLPSEERAELIQICDRYLAKIMDVLEPEWVIGVGQFARDRAEDLLGASRVKVGTILHPSPASPASNQNWEGKVVRQLEQLGVW